MSLTMTMLVTCFFLPACVSVQVRKTFLASRECFTPAKEIWGETLSALCVRS